jgi:helicase
MVKVADLPLPASLKECYLRAGIRELYPPQSECIEKGMFEGKNLLVAIPTASGKTLVAEMAMHHHIARGGKCLYIVPLKALASEKFEDFSGKSVKVGISTGDLDRRDEYLGRNDIIVATSEKVDSLLRNAAPWLQEITLLVVDEVHLIESPDRGATLEMVITKMRSRNPAMQLIALSATIGNPGSLAQWLDAPMVTSTWRPVDLRQGVYYDGTIRFHDGQRPVPIISKYEDLNLMMDTIEEGGQCLAFVSSRKNSEAFAKRAAKAIKGDSPELDDYRTRLEKLASTDADRVLAACVGQGAAFHHAGLRREERSVVEEGFRKGHIKCIASTPTLAAGLNLPARRVIIRDYRRYSGGEGMVPIPAREYHQMAGRAGRPHLDPYGESVLIAKDEQEVAALFEYYIEADPEDVNSQCASEAALTTHILSLIASRFARSRAELGRFMEQTFYHHQRKGQRILNAVIDRSLRFLEDAEMVVENGDLLSSTEFGTLVSQLYIDPHSADLIVRQLGKAEEYSDIGLLQMVCATPDMYTLYVANRDLHYLERFVFEHDRELWMDLPIEDEEEYYRTLKTAMVLNDWSMEVPEAMICERYSIGPGDVYNLVESVNWLLHATGRLAQLFATRYSKAGREYEICMKNGVKRELLPLVQLPQIGRVRARRLFNSGITGPGALKEAGEERISTILGRGVARQVFQALLAEDTETPRREEKLKTGSGIVDLSHFGVNK